MLKPELVSAATHHNALELHDFPVNPKTSMARTQNENGHERRGASEGVHHSAPCVVHVSKNIREGFVGVCGS